MTNGTYYIFDTDMDGWTDETLANALKWPLAEIGIEIEIEQRFNPYYLNDELTASEQSDIINNIKHIVDKISSQ